MSNFDEMGKVELRAACKEAGIKYYGKMNNDGMREALKAHYAEPVQDEQTAQTEPEAVVTEPEASAEEAEQSSAPSAMGRMWLQLLGAGRGETKKQEERAPASAKSTSTGLKIEKNREERNGIKRPSVGGTCRAVWDAMDEMVASGKNPSAKDVKALVEERGWNPNNASIEFYQWRKFHGIRGRQA